MSEDVMRLVAEIVDKFSGPSKDLVNALKEINKASKTAHTEGAAAAREHAKQQRELHERIAKTGEGMRTILSPALAAVGISALTLEKVYEKVADAIKEASEKFLLFNDTAKRSSMNIGAISQQVKAFELLGVSADDAHKSIAEVGAMMDKLKRGGPSQAGEMARLLGGGLVPGQAERIIQQLKAAKSNEEGERIIHDIMKGEKFQHLPADQKLQFGQLFKQPDRFSLATTEEMNKTEHEAAEARAKNPPDPKSWEALHEAMEKATTSAEGLNGAIVKAFGGASILAIDGFSHSLDYLSELLRHAKEMADSWIDAAPDWFKRHSKDRDPPQSVVPKTREEILRGGPLDPHRNNSNYRPTFGATPVSFMQGGSSGDAAKLLEEGTKQGVLAAFREWMGGAAASAGGGGGGITNASFNPGGGGAGGSPRFGSSAYPNMGGGGGGGGGGGDDAPMGSNAANGVGAGLKGSAFLQAQRARFAEELKNNPQTAKELAALTTLEGNPANVTESLMNRMAMTGGSIKGGMHGGRGKSFYGPIRSGMLPGAMAALERNPKRMAQVNAAIASVLAGRNVLKGATDQGMKSDPNGSWQGGMVHGQDQVYNDWGGGGGHEASRRFRENQQRQVAIGGDTPSKLELPGSSAGSITGGPNSEYMRGAYMRDRASHHTNHHLSVDFNNMPKGTRTKYNGDAGLFKEVKLNRGTTMGMANQDA